MIPCISALAAYDAIDADVFPVDAQATRFMPRTFACVRIFGQAMFASGAKSGGGG